MFFPDGLSKKSTKNNFTFSKKWVWTSVASVPTTFSKSLASVAIVPNQIWLLTDLRFANPKVQNIGCVSPLKILSWPPWSIMQCFVRTYKTLPTLRDRICVKNYFETDNHNLNRFLKTIILDFYLIFKIIKYG